MIGTLILSPFIGSGNFNPLLTAVLIFLVLSMLIIIGLVAGSLISPLIFFLISKQKSDSSKAIVTLLVSAMLIVSLPLLRFFMEKSAYGYNFGILGYFPFTIAASLMIFILYGETIGFHPWIGVCVLLIYILIIILFGWNKADKLYSLDEDIIRKNNTNPKSRYEVFLKFITKPIPSPYKNLARLIIKASFRDLEHMSRLTIGISVTIFMIFALSSKGLFRGSTNFSEGVELSVVIFSLVLSSASVIFIDASSFTVQHKDMFAMIKASPAGAKKFIVAKVIQMLYFILPIFVTLIIVLSQVGYISPGNRIPLILIIGMILLSLICTSLAVYFVSPVDNPEDITNFINLLIFYVIAFVLAIAPVVVVLINRIIPSWFLAVYFLFSILLSFLSLHIAIRAFDEMNIETLNSQFSNKFMLSIKIFLLYLIVMNISPLIAIQYLIKSGNLLNFLLISNILSLIPMILLWISHIIHPPNFTLKKGHIINIILGCIGMLLLALPSIIFSSLIEINTPFLQLSTFTTKELILLLVLPVFVEELFFRGIVYDISRDKFTDIEVIIISSFLFSLSHIQSIISTINAFFQGMILGYFRIKNGSISSPIIMHLIYNGLVIAFILI